MAELTGGSVSDDDTHASPDPRPPRPPRGGGGGGDRRFADEIHSVTIHARQRTFYIDLKQSGNGKFLKISEKSRGGQKTTIMFDVEDLDKFIEALQDMKSHV